MLEYGVAVVPFGSGYYSNALFATYVGGASGLHSAYSLDGSNYSDQGLMIDHNTGKGFAVNCRQAATCGPGVTTFQGSAYIAYADETTLGLDVIKVVPIPGNTGWYFTLVYTNTSVQLTSSPAVAVAPDGVHLIIRYGTSNVPNQKNGTYTTEFNGTTWSTYASGGLAPTQSAIVAFNGNFYALDKQDNSGTPVHVSRIDNNGVYIPGTSYEVSGWQTNAGIAATVYDGNIVAVIQSSQSNHDLYVFSSPDGVNWYGQGYPNIQIGATPSITDFNGGVVSAYQANNSSYYLYSSFAP